MVSPDTIEGKVKRVEALDHERDRNEEFGRKPSAERRINAHRLSEHDAVDRCLKGPVASRNRAVAEYSCS